MKNFSFLLIAILMTTIAQSQGSLKGKIMDSTSNKGLAYATVAVFKANDTTLITYRMSTPDGEFKVPGLPLDINCRVVITYSGYGVYRKEFTTSQSSPQFDIGTILLMPDAKSLDEVLVMAERPPVIFKKDTIEFNASSFKTLPNALVEDLLKKLPGVQVDRDGNIMVNGKPVNRILVDGKTFFGDDPKMATRNLPANIIDKVQVTDDKEEMMRNGDDNPNNVGKVVNITLKKGVKKGWFGRLYAGGGSEKLFEMGGIANIYRDTLQLSVLAYGNNLNKAGFSMSELMSAGGFDRIRSNSSSNQTSNWNSNAGSGVSINGVNFGGQQNFGGISTSWGTGFNLNHAPNKKRSMFLQYFNGNVRAPRHITTVFDQFTGDTVFKTNTVLTGDFVTHGHFAGAGIRLIPDSVTNFLFNANYQLGLQEEDRNSEIDGRNNIDGILSDGNIIQNNDGDLHIYRHSLNYTKLSRTKKGRRFNFIHQMDVNNRYNYNTSESDTRYFYPAIYDSVYAQLRRERMPRTDIWAMFNYSEPLNKNFTIRLSGRYEFGKVNNQVHTFNRSTGSPKYDLLNESLSSDFRRQSHRYYVNPAIEYKWKEVLITPSLRFLVQRINNRLIAPATEIPQRDFSVLPGLNIRWKSLNGGFSRDINLPNFTQLNPANDISNPWFIVKGNPGLLPIKRTNFFFNYFFNDPKRYINTGGWMEASFITRDIVQSITVNQLGIQTSQPVNARDTRSYSMNANVNKQYKNAKNIMFSWNTGNWTNWTRSQLFYNNTMSWQTTFQYNHWFGTGMNLNDVFELNLNWSFGVNTTRYTTSQFRELNIWRYDVGGDAVLRWPKRIIWETQVNLNFRDNVPAGYPKESLRWNGALNITMLKDDRGVLKFAVNDILNRNNGLGINATRNTLTTTYNTILRRYFLATFTYNVRPAGVKKRIGGRERFFLF